MLKKILLALLAIVIALVVVIAMRPSEYGVSRSAMIPATPEVAFALVNDFRNWDKWSPWAKLDPNMKVSHSGPETGEGSVYEWEGNSDVGKGKMTIRQSHPHQHVAIELEFMEPFASLSDTDFRFQSASGGTQVTWEMKGSLGFMEKAFGLFMDMEGMIGKDFEKGLGQMAEAAKAMPTPQTETTPEGPRP